MGSEASEPGRRISAAQLSWRDGAPHSHDFDDVFFSGGGAAEAEHVFVSGNDLAARFARADRFTIGELGFGTGLNVLKAWALWRTTARTAARLYLFSIEGFPLSADDLARAHRAWPDLAALAGHLRARLPPPVPGYHTLRLAPDVTLTLAYGPVDDMLANAEIGVDAWFFDGFSPAKNPDMWRPEIFAAAARLSNAGATFATFTVAGDVRRAVAKAGFAVEKRPGFGRKKEMLAGAISDPPRIARRAPWFRHANARALAPGASLAIIGGGIAGASLAFAARRAGLTPTIFDPAGLAAGASGNPAGLIMPRLDLGDGVAARFFLAAYLHTIRLLSDIGGGFNRCGVLLGAADDEDRSRQAKLIAEAKLPPDWMKEHARGLCFPQAGVVDPRALVGALAADAPVKRVRATEIRRSADHLMVRFPDGSHDEFDAIVLANGADALSFVDARTLPLEPIAGQIDWFPAARAPEIALAFGAYAAPAPGGGLIIGATYEKLEAGAEATTNYAATISNIDAVRAFAPDLVEGLDPAGSRPRASARCQTPDRLPVAGPLPDLGFFGAAYDDLRLGLRKDYPPGEMVPGLFILSGLGSRGLVTAPLAAELMIAEMTGAPAPVDHAIAEALHPARFFIRDLKRAQTIRKG